MNEARQLWQTDPMHALRGQDAARKGSIGWDGGPLIDLAMLERAAPAAEPFPHIVVERFIRPAALETINADFPAVSQPRNHDVTRLDYGLTFGSLLAELADPAWMALLGEKLGVGALPELPFNTTVRAHCESSDGNIHTDHWSKVVTVLIYTNPTWTAAGGRLRVLRSGTDLEDYATEVVPAAGTMLAFRRTPRSFHGHHRHVGSRRLIQISWLRRNPFARIWQGLARSGTHLAKRAGLHPDSV